MVKHKTLRLEGLPLNPVPLIICGTLGKFTPLRLNFLFYKTGLIILCASQVVLYIHRVVHISFLAWILTQAKLPVAVSHDYFPLLLPPPSFSYSIDHHGRLTLFALK